MARLLGRGPGEPLWIIYSLQDVLGLSCMQTFAGAFSLTGARTLPLTCTLHSCHLTEFKSSISSSKKVSLSLCSGSPRWRFSPQDHVLVSLGRLQYETSFPDPSLLRDLKYHKRRGLCLERSLQYLRRWDCRGCLFLQHILVWPNWYSPWTSWVEVGRETQFFSDEKDRSHEDLFQPCFQSTGESRSEERRPTKRGRDGERALISRSSWFSSRACFPQWPWTYTILGRLSETTT